MAAELAIRGTLTLARNSGDGPMPLKEICEARELPRDYMARIFGDLSRAQIVAAVRGKGGGYRLARPAETISLLDIIEAVEGPLALNLCQFDPPQCEERDCPVRPVWTDLQETVRRALKSKTLDMLVCPEDHAPAPTGGGTDPEN